MVYDVRAYVTGTGIHETEIEILEYPDDEAPKEINTTTISTFRFYNRREAEECARNYGR
ncbi:MAG: hypothetical protein LBC76_02335 [Treponema sp.]|nr:hypothetical protein [Treponema sp.]